ncbi:MAG: hypothetical protein JMDDDDMK_00401 [Acidobacteria bacterium]|nr:hypothetical protein [Acidobacteriota bacterium]
MFFREIDAGDETAFVIERAFVPGALFGLPFLLAVIPAAFGFADDARAASFDRLAEKIIGANLDFGVLARQIIAAIRFDVDNKIGQVVAADFE